MDKMILQDYKFSVLMPININESDAELLQTIDSIEVTLSANKEW